MKLYYMQAERFAISHNIIIISGDWKQKSNDYCQ